MKRLLLSLLSIGTLSAETLSLEHTTPFPPSLIQKKFLLQKDFLRLMLNIPATFILNTHSKHHMVQVKIDEKFANAIEVSIRNKRLIIQASKNIVTKLPISIIINTQKGIQEIVTKGSISLTVNNLHESYLKLITQGISKIKFNIGVIDNLLINSKGTYGLNLKATDTKKLFLHAKGIGKIEVKVSNFLEAELFDLVKVYYAGEAKIKKNLNGLSQLKRR